MSALTQTYGSLLRLTRSFVQGDNKVEIVSNVEHYHRQDGYRTIYVLSDDTKRLKEIKARLAQALPDLCKKNATI